MSKEPLLPAEIRDAIVLIARLAYIALVFALFI